MAVVQLPACVRAVGDVGRRPSVLLEVRSVKVDQTSLSLEIQLSVFFSLFLAIGCTDRF